MIRLETRNQIKAIIDATPEGISLTEIHGQFYKEATRLQIRAILGVLYKSEAISRERRKVKGFKTTIYFPFNGKKIVIRKRNFLMHQSGDILTSKDFLANREFAPFPDIGHVLGEDTNNSPILFIPNTIPNYE